MGLKTISPDALQQLMQNGKCVVIDVNSRGNWMKVHVPGATNLDPAGYNESDLPTEKNTTLVFYCSNPMCMKAPNAARRARGIGYNDVRVMSVGISGWATAQLPTESGA
jgi:rhodanese-related sulfurtransferase